jgi:hypothetical protein
MAMTAPAGLLTDGVRAINIGLAGFADPIRAAGAPVVALDWRPPAAGDRALGLLLARLEDDPTDPIGGAIAAANGRAVERILAAQPALVDVRPASEAIDGFGGRMLLHSGPPIEWAGMCGPDQGAAIGACLFEGWAATPAEARALLDADKIAFAPCHDHGAVGPMAGVVSPSMPVVVVENGHAQRGTREGPAVRGVRRHRPRTPEMVRLDTRACSLDGPPGRRPH